VVKTSPEWITGPERGKSSGRIATFSLWTGMFRDYKTNVQIAKELKITQILDILLEYKRSWIQHVNRMPRNRLPGVILLPNWQVAQLHERYMMMMMMTALSQNCEKRLLASSCLPVRMEQHGTH